MTTFILHGGYTSTPNESNKRYYSEIINRTPENGKILFIYFAQDKSKWPGLLKNDKENMRRTGIRKILNSEIASPENNKLIEQIKSADCIYLRGGPDDPLRKKLEEINRFGNLIKEKVVVGSSAGANVLSKYCWRNSKKCVEEGLGILPIKVFCHYNETKKEALEQLRDYKEDLPVYTIPETEFVMIER